MRLVAIRALPRLGLLGVLLAPLPGCSGAMAGSQAPPATIAFVNQSTEQANVYAFGMNGDPRRIGTVAPGQTQQLRLPSGLIASGSVHIVARPLATRRLAVSGPITIGPGDTFTVTMPPGQNTLNVLPGLP